MLGDAISGCSYPVTRGRMKARRIIELTITKLPIQGPIFAECDVLIGMKLEGRPNRLPACLNYGR